MWFIRIYYAWYKIIYTFTCERKEYNVWKRKKLVDYSSISKSNVNNILDKAVMATINYDINEIMQFLNNLLSKDWTIIVETEIINYLKIIKSKSLTYANFCVIQRDINIIIDMFSNSKKILQIEEACFNAKDLILKVIEYNERKISLPTNLDNIITYQFRYSVAKKDIKLVVWYFYLYLAIFCYLLDSKDYSKDLKRYKIHKEEYEISYYLDYI